MRWIGWLKSMIYIKSRSTWIDMRFLYSKLLKERKKQSFILTLAAFCDYIAISYPIESQSRRRRRHASK